MTSELSLLCLESIIPHIDANKRIHLSISNPSLRHLEKPIPLKIENLELTPSRIKINSFSYILGEILVPDITSLDEREVEEIRLRNSKGGLEWRGLEDAVLVNGDVELPRGVFYDVFKYSEEQKLELMNYLRREFMESLEMYLKAPQQDQTNPLEIFELSETEDSFNCRTRINNKFPSQRKIKNVMDVIEIIEEGKLLCFEDKISYQFPKAFLEMKKEIERMENESQTLKRQFNFQKSKTLLYQLSVLKKLAYPHEVPPHFNQLTVIHAENHLMSLKSLPDGLSLRQAFKKFSTAIFEGRRHLKIEELQMNGIGIIGLPKELKLDVDVIREEGNEVIFEEYAKIVETVKKIYFSSIKDGEVLKIPMVQNCVRLEISDPEPIQLDASPFSSLQNEILLLNISAIYFDNYINIILNWSKSKHRKLRDKLQISIHEILETNVFQACQPLLKIGFSCRKQGIGNEQSMFLRLSEEMEIVLTVLEISSENIETLKFKSSEYKFIHLEVVETEDSQE